jgi:hypothetical protein
MLLTRLILAATVALLALTAGPAQAATRELEHVPNDTPTKVAGSGAVAVWSTYDTAAHNWRLVASRDGGPVTALPVPAAAKPFDVNLGRDAGGALVAVYTRCAPGCDIYELDLTTGVETHLTAISSPSRDEHDPSIYNGSIAFVRDEPVSGKPGHVLRLAAAGADGTRALAKTNRDGVRSPALTDDRVAYVVDITGGGRYGFGEQDVHVRTLGLGRVSNVYKAVSGGANESVVTNLVLDPTNRHVFLWARTNNGSGQGNRIVRYAAAGAGSFTYALGSNLYTSIASAGGALGIVAVKEGTSVGAGTSVLSLGSPPFDAAS